MGSAEEPLLAQTSADRDHYADGLNSDDAAVPPTEDLPPSLTTFPTGAQISAEIGRQWTLALPILVTIFLQVLLTTLTSIFAGRIGEQELAAASLGTSVYNASGFWLLSGLAGAVDTLAGQAFGAKQYHRLGEIVQRGLVVNTAACIPVGLLWWNGERVLLALGQDPGIATMTAHFLVGLFPGLLGSAWRVPLVRFFAAQRVVRPVAGCAAIALLVHVTVNYVLVFVLGYGLMGVSYAFSFTQVFYLLLLLGYIMCSEIRGTTWSRWSWRATFSELRPHLSLALPSMIMVCLECWSYELALFLAGLLPNPAVTLSTVNIAINIMMLAFTFGSGWGVAISVRVSNELGADCPERARLAVIASVAGALFSSATVTFILFLCRYKVGLLFTDSQAIIDLTAELVPVLCLAAAADTVQYTLAGVLRGSGKQKVGAVSNLFSYYVVGLPSAVVLGFYFGFGAKGLWVGLALAVFTCLSIYSVIASRLDWKEEARRAKARVSTRAAQLV